MLEKESGSFVSDLGDLSVVVLSYNRLAELSFNLPALIDISRRRGFELIVVDNASTDGSVELIRALAVGENMKVILNETNFGVAGGRNFGWGAAERDFILNIDDDTIISEEAICSMLKFIRSNNQFGIVSPRIVHSATGQPQYDLGDEVLFPSNHHGACNIMRSSVVRTVGPNDARCTFGGEEFNYSVLVRELGFDVVYLPHITVGHNNHQREGRAGAERRIRRAYNLPRLYAKHFPYLFAAQLSFRYAVSHSISAVRAFGWSLGIKVILSVIWGFRAGRITYRPVSSRVVSFYRDENLVPDFGNIPIHRKILRRVGIRSSVEPSGAR